ncbi:MAG: hypothetical protein M0021_00895 [Clostridia bacterium]|nr:hypothetical protein [Clostridia bacterium]
MDDRSFTVEGDSYQVKSLTTLISETMIMHLEARKLAPRNLPAATLGRTGELKN